MSYGKDHNLNKYDAQSGVCALTHTLTHSLGPFCELQRKLCFNCEGFNFMNACRRMWRGNLASL